MVKKFKLKSLQPFTYSLSDAVYIRMNHILTPSMLKHKTVFHDYKGVCVNFYSIFKELMNQFRMKVSHDQLNR